MTAGKSTGAPVPQVPIGSVPDESTYTATAHQWQTCQVKNQDQKEHLSGAMIVPLGDEETHGDENETSILAPTVCANIDTSNVSVIQTNVPHNDQSLTNARTGANTAAMVVTSSYAANAPWPFARTVSPLTRSHKKLSVPALISMSSWGPMEGVVRWPFTEWVTQDAPTTISQLTSYRNYLHPMKCRSCLAAQWCDKCFNLAIQPRFSFYQSSWHQFSPWISHQAPY